MPPALRRRGRRVRATGVARRSSGRISSFNVKVSSSGAHGCCFRLVLDTVARLRAQPVPMSLPMVVRSVGPAAPRTYLIRRLSCIIGRNRGPDGRPGGGSGRLLVAADPCVTCASPFTNNNGHLRLPVVGVRYLHTSRVRAKGTDGPGGGPVRRHKTSHSCAPDSLSGGCANSCGKLARRYPIRAYP